jgi:hypothetical protein
MVCEGAPIHVFVDCIKGKTWMAGLPPPMTVGRCRSRIEALIQRQALIAFHQACDQHDFEVAERMLPVLEMVISGRWHQPAAPDPRGKESLVAAYERLWQLRHPDAAGESDAPE